MVSGRRGGKKLCNAGAVNGEGSTNAMRRRRQGALADEFTIALDRCGWMIVPQPQFGDRRWFMNYPSDACPGWADKDVAEKPSAPLPRLRVIDGGKNKAALD